MATQKGDKSASIEQEAEQPELSVPNNEQPPSVDNATATQPAWLHTYSTLTSKLPTPIASHLPSTSTAASLSAQLSEQLSLSSAKVGEHLSTTSAKLGELSRNSSQRFKESKTVRKLSPDQFLTNAYSVTNTTQVAINVSLNQVSPLMFQVLLPNETFERRVPDLWFNLQLRPYTSPSTAYNTWSTTWPILALTGPVVAATSLLLVPFAAVAVGGAALASLTGFGSAAVAGAAEGVAAVASAGGTAAGLVAKAAHLPGGNKVKGKLVDAAKKAFGVGSKEEAASKVVKYLVAGPTAAAALGGVAVGDEEDRGRAKKRQEKRGKKLEEIEVTGYELEKVLKCETGKKKVDRALMNAFDHISFKTSHFKASSNPVLNITGGPELEVRGKHSFLVFYPFVLEPVTDVTVEAIPITEVPPTPEESTFIKDAAVVENTADADEVAKRAPRWAEGSKDEVEEVVKAVEAKTTAAEGKKDAGWWGKWSK